MTRRGRVVEVGRTGSGSYVLIRHQNGQQIIQAMGYSSWIDFTGFGLRPGVKAKVRITCERVAGRKPNRKGGGR